MFLKIAKINPFRCYLFRTILNFKGYSNLLDHLHDVVNFKSRIEVTMAIPTIFPNSLSDAENLIVQFLDPRSQVRLSGVSSRAYTVLSNVPHFQRLFAEQHPLLAKMDQVFLQLNTYYPECSWKVACCTMVEGPRPFKREFLERAVPSIRADLLLEREKIESKKHLVELQLRAICGSYYQDPNSPIHQAWKNRVQVERDIDLCTLEWARETQKISDLFNHTLDERFFQEPNEGILDIINPYKAQGYVRILSKISASSDPSEKRLVAINRLFSLLQGEKAVEFFSKDIARIQAHPQGHLFDLNLLDKYREAATFFLSHKEKITQFHKKNYLYLENDRQSYKHELKKYSAKLARLDQLFTEACRYNHLNLLSDSFFATKPWGFALHLNHFRCTISMCNVHKSNKIDHDFLRPAINVLTEKHLVWETLYHCCAKGVIEESWSEKHFHEFLPELQNILVRLESQADSFGNAFCDNLDLFIGNFVDVNFEEIKLHLPALKALQEKIQPPPNLAAFAGNGINDDWYLDLSYIQQIYNLFLLENSNFGCGPRKLSRKILDLLIKSLEAREIQGAPLN